MRKYNGITLIAVVITVIVMIILAGVSISITVGNDGIIQNSQKAAEDTKLSESKECILEAWAYVLAKCEDISILTYLNIDTDKVSLSNEEYKIFTKASDTFKKYISNYGEGSLTQICLIESSEQNITKYAYKIEFEIKGSKEQKNFYIVNDTKVYEEDEFIKFLEVQNSNELENKIVVRESE